MVDWSTPAERLATVAPEAKPARNWVWYVNTTVWSCAGLSVACVAIAYVVMR